MAIYTFIIFRILSVKYYNSVYLMIFEENVIFHNNFLNFCIWLQKL